MKVYLLMYYNYDDTDHYGIYSTQAKAEEAADELYEKSKYTYLDKHGVPQVYASQNRHYFDIQEVEVV